MKTRYALVVMFVMTLFVNKAISQTQKECLPNIGFESGAFTPWECKWGTYGTTGTNTTPVIELSTVAPMAAQHAITSGTGTDPNTNGAITVVAPGGGRFSAKIGDESGQLGMTQQYSNAEGLSYTINPVTKENAGLTYMYAVVLEESGGGTVHSSIESPRFEVVLTDNTKKQQIPCGHYLVDANGHKGLTQGKTSMNGTWWYSKWTKVAIDLSKFIGSSVTLEFRVNDCAPLQGGKYTSGTHAGYAYIDLMCEPIIVTSPIICADQKTVQICGPDGFNIYQWTQLKKITGVITGPTNGRCITVTDPKPGEIYKVTLSTFGGNAACNSEMIDTLRGFTLKAEKDVTLCPDKNPTFDLNAIPTPQNQTKYKWTTLPPGSPAGSDTMKSPKGIPTPKQNTTYTVVATDKDGCTATATVTIKIACDIDVTLDPSVICEGEGCVTLEAKPTGGIAPIHYTWDPSPDPGNDDKAGPFKVCPTKTTIYTVTIKDAQGKTASDTAIVIVHPKPVIKIRDTLICKNTSVVLTADGADKYTWVSPNTPLDLSTTTGATVTATPTATTTYTIFGESDKGCKDTATVTVVVNDLPILKVDPKAICKDDSATLTVTGAISYVWTSPTTPSDLSSTTGATVIAKPKATTTYTIVGELAKGCIGTTTVTVTVNNPPVIDAGPDKVICLGDSAQLQATGGVTYKWTGIGIKNPTLANPWAVPTVTTTYKVVGTDANGCVSYDTVKVTVNPPVKITVSPGGTICQGDSIGISVSGEPGYTYLWENAAGLSNTTAQNIKASPAITTTYTVTGTNGLCPPDKKTVTINVNPVPKAKFTLDKYEGCVPLFVNFGNISTNAAGATCTWYFGDPASGAANQITTTGLKPVGHNYATVGKFTIKLVVVAAGGCSDSLTYTDTVKTYPYPVADFTFSPEQADIWKPAITYFNKSTGEDPNALKWYLKSDPGKIVSTKPEFTKVYPDAGTYDMCLDVVTTHGCPDKICKPVTITPDWSFFIPNAFSPNADGKNEKFNGVGVNVIEYKMDIFDRWGLHICTINKIDTQDDRGNGWDGTVDGGSGEKQQEDTYVYKVQLTDIFHKKHYYVGRVTLIK